MSDTKYSHIPDAFPIECVKDLLEALRVRDWRKALPCALQIITWGTARLLLEGWGSPRELTIDEVNAINELLTRLGSQWDQLSMTTRGDVACVLSQSDWRGLIAELCDCICREFADNGFSLSTVGQWAKANAEIQR